MSETDDFHDTILVSGKPQKVSVAGEADVNFPDLLITEEDPLNYDVNIWYNTVERVLKVRETFGRTYIFTWPTTSTSTSTTSSTSSSSTTSTSSTV